MTKWVFSKEKCYRVEGIGPFDWAEMLDGTEVDFSDTENTSTFRRTGWYGIERCWCNEVEVAE